MKWLATAANCLWLASSASAATRFRRALAFPQETQIALLLDQITRNSESSYGKQYEFKKFRSYQDFANAVPIIEYKDLEPWIERIREGGQNLLTAEPVTHLVPTSGSTAGCKLIPFTCGLQREFNHAIAPWLTDLARQRPGILFGPAYWSISPPLQRNLFPLSKVPIGFADDSEYLGRNKRRIVQASMVLPRTLAPDCDLDTFRFETLRALLLARDLRFISVWHPSFLVLLLDALPNLWVKLLQSIEVQARRRAKELAKSDPQIPSTIWSKLLAVSCWGDGFADMPLKELQSRLPRVLIQPKGLLATEACVTIPFQQSHPIAICSHFYEFLEDGGEVRQTHELEEGRVYEVIVTTSGGLWRYRLGDRVRVIEFLNRTPCLCFLGRARNVSDRFGEKLDASFVDAIVRDLCGDQALFAMLAPSKEGESWCYKLYLEGEVSLGSQGRLEAFLQRNPHYQLCRDLGQLQPAKIVPTGPKAFERYAACLMARGMRLGDIKPASLSQLDLWDSVFEGGSREKGVQIERNANVTCA